MINYHFATSEKRKVNLFAQTETGSLFILSTIHGALKCEEEAPVLCSFFKKLLIKKHKKLYKKENEFLNLN